MRGTEKPQMSASITPTAYPCSASAAARLVVIDDLPTPPFPEATITTLVVEGMLVSGAFWLTLKRALAIASDRSSWVSSPQSIVTRVTPATRSVERGCPLDLGAQGAAARGEVDLETDPSVVGDGGALGHAEFDDVASEFGSITPRIKPMT